MNLFKLFEELFGIKPNQEIYINNSKSIYRINDNLDVQFFNDDDNTWTKSILYSVFSILSDKDIIVAVNK